MKSKKKPQQNAGVMDAIRHIAENDPGVLTNALRDAGNYVYLIVPADIENGCEVGSEGYFATGKTQDEIGHLLSKHRDKLDELVEYGDLVESILSVLRDQERGGSK